jgi:hypothetical protein
MDKKKIYIIVIVVCVAVTAGILYFGMSSPASEDTATHTGALQLSDTNPSIANVGSSSAEVPVPDAVTSYAPPIVFPSDTNLDLSVFQSSSFRNLVDYTPLTITEAEIGRDNPYLDY